MNSIEKIKCMIKRFPRLPFLRYLRFLLFGIFLASLFS
jgi:hypothetical protein